MGVEENQSICTPSSAAKRKRKLGGDSDDDDDDDDDSDDQAEDEDDEEEEEMKKVKKVETYDEVKTDRQIHYENWLLKDAHRQIVFCPVRMKLIKPPVSRSWRSRLRN